MSVLELHINKDEIIKRSTKYIYGTTLENYVKLGFKKNDMSQPTYNDIRNWLEENKQIFISEIYDKNLKLWKYSIYISTLDKTLEMIEKQNRHESLADVITKISETL